ncbi:hypothetical protein V3851_11850 [Paenibacillus sp. M1]|uniref:Uncharacterized protein n=1 Tax=Paenibacillus haidiansis TaxID=1574488 RepID=A0ABU7VSS3_9BACL
MPDLYSTLFDLIEARNQHLQSLNISEGVTGDTELRTLNGEMIGELHEGVLGQLDITFGDESATITDNVMSGSKIDFGNGDVFNSYENVYGGETFRSLTDVVGYTQPNSISGGIDLYNGNYEKVASLSNPDMFGYTDFSYSSILTDISELDFTAQNWSLFDSTYDFVVDLDNGDTMADILSMIADWS